MSTRIPREAYALYLVTDDPSRYTHDFLENIEAAVAGGVSLVQYRDTESTDREKLRRARRLAEWLRPRGIPLIINNDIALALAVDADGIHVGQSDYPSTLVRRLVGSAVAIDLSVTCVADIATVDSTTVQAVGIGPVYDARRTKADAAPAMGLEGFQAIREQLHAHPAVAIGGITLTNAASLYAAGADGLAVVSAFSRASNPETVAREFCAIRKAVKG